MTEHAPSAALGAAPASFDSLRAVVHQRFDRLSPHLQRVARLALEEPNAIALGTVSRLARRLSVQPSSVVRFAQALGLTGFSELQQICRTRLVEGAPDRRERTLATARHRAGEKGRAGRMLREFADANARALESLVAGVPEADLERGIEMVRQAGQVWVIGARRAFPVAAYLFYCLVRLERRCQLLDAVGGMVPQQVATMTTNDLLIAVSFAEYAAFTVDTVKDAQIRGIPTLTITDRETSPLAHHADLSFRLGDPDGPAFRPLAAALCLAQTLVVAAADAVPAPIPRAPRRRPRSA